MFAIPDTEAIFLTGKSKTKVGTGVIIVEGTQEDKIGFSL